MDDSSACGDARTTSSSCVHSSSPTGTSTNVPRKESKWTVDGKATWKVVLLLAWPVLLQQFLVLAVNLSDAFLAGNYRAVSPIQEAQAHGYDSFAAIEMGTAAIPGQAVPGMFSSMVAVQQADKLMARQTAIQSAQTTAMYMAWFLNSMTVLITVGSTALVARFIGAGKTDSAIRVTNQSVLLGIVFSILITIVGLYGIDDFVRLLQLKGLSAQFAADYLRPMILLLVFQVILVVGIACLVGAGDTRTGLWVMGSVAILNIPVSFLLCLGYGPVPRFGFVGISMGTAYCNVIGGIAILILLARGRSGLHLSWAYLIPNFDLLRRLLRISLPASLDSLSLLAGQFWFLSIVNQLGDVASSAHGVAIRWEALGFLSGIAFGTAAATLVGQNLGAGKPQQAARTGWTAFGIGCLVMTAMGILFFALADPMFRLFFPHPWQHDSVIVGVPVLRLIAFAMPPLASAIIFVNALRGAGDTTFPLFFTWIGFLLVRIPLAYLFTKAEVDVWWLGTIPGFDLGLFGAWLAMCADLVLRGGLFMWRFAGGAWKKVEV